MLAQEHILVEQFARNRYLAEKGKGNRERQNPNSENLDMIFVGIN